MSSMDSGFLYCPALRMKKGEMNGLFSLAPDVIAEVRPRIVVPPEKDRDGDLQGAATLDELAYNIGRKIAASLPMRAAYFEPRFLIDQFGIAGSDEWLPRLFEVARSAGSLAIPLASLDELLTPSVAGFRKAMSLKQDVKIAIRIESGQIDTELKSKLAAVLSTLGIRPEECSVIADFSDADFSEPEIVSGIAQGALEDLQAIGQWKHVIFQGTNYPEFNPAEPNDTFSVSRNEWIAWKLAVNFDANTASRLIFGDYGADSAKFSFKSGGGGMPIRHFRYATPDSWLVARGANEGKHEPVMKAVAKSVLSSGKFAGSSFSKADEFIHQMAHGHAGPGDASKWREINMAHHITRVVKDIGQVRGRTFASRKSVELMEQDSLFGNADQ